MTEPLQNLLILCEGDTEREVLKPFLKPYLERFEPEPELISYSGNGELKKKFKRDAETHLISKNCSVLCLVDLYEHPFGIDPSQKLPIEERFRQVQAEMYRQIETQFHPRFGGFPVVMELETWILADSNIQNNKLGGPIRFPEQIAHPAEYLKRIYDQKKLTYTKLTQGINLFAEASAKRIYADTCPHFNLMIDWLKQPPPDEEKIEISSKHRQWEEGLSQRYNYALRLEENMQSDQDLDQTIAAWSEYDNFLRTYDHLFND